jgi:hypothetical protein
VTVGVRVGEAVGVRVTVAVFVWEGVTAGPWLDVPSRMGADSGVRVARGVSVGIADGPNVALGSMGRATGTVVAGKNWFATGSPNRAEATVDESNTNASNSHCHPASMYSLRVR